MDMLDLVHIKTMMVRLGALVAHAPTTKLQHGAPLAAYILRLLTLLLLTAKDHLVMPAINMPLFRTAINTQSQPTAKDHPFHTAINMPLVMPDLCSTSPKVDTKESMAVSKPVLRIKAKVHRYHP